MKLSIKMHNKIIIFILLYCFSATVSVATATLENIKEYKLTDLLNRIKSNSLNNTNDFNDIYFNDIEIKFPPIDAIVASVYVQAQICIRLKNDKNICCIIKREQSKIFASGKAKSIPNEHITKLRDMLSDNFDIMKEALNDLIIPSMFFKETAALLDSVTGASRIRDAEKALIYYILAEATIETLFTNALNTPISNIKNINVAIIGSKVACRNCDEFFKRITRKHERLIIFTKGLYKLAAGRMDSGIDANRIYRYFEGDRE